MKHLIFVLCFVIVSSSSLRAEEPLTIAAVSCESRIRNTEFNLKRIEHWARRAAKQKADLVLFPECGLHAWWQSRENRRFAETVPGPSTERLTKLAKELDLVLVVGIIERDGSRYYITQVVIALQGVIAKQRKRELAGGPSGEVAVWDVGKETAIFPLKGRKLGIAICYESVHPRICALLKKKGAEIILAPYANGTHPEEIREPKPGVREWMWRRVEETKMWYIACDATPHDQDGKLLPGAAYAIAPDSTLAACTPSDGDGEAMIIVTIPAK